MHYYRHHIGDFLKDTGHLSNDQMGVYLRMLWRYYLDEKPLKDDCESIAFAMRSDGKTVGLILHHFFVLQDEGWRHKRCDKEIADYHEKKEKAANSANARWKDANAMRTHTERNADAPVLDANHKPITNIQYKDITSDPPTSRFDEFWSAWPTSKRKVARSACEAKWRRQALDPLADKIIASVTRLRASEQWVSGFEPAPLTFINQKRWEDESETNSVNGSGFGRRVI